MIEHLNAFLSILFEPHQSTCFTYDARGTRVGMPTKYDLFFSINALDTERDNCPSEPYHRPDRPRRADGNVTCFRNFLIELDGMPLEQQIDYVCSKVPVTSIVYSGGKSYHFIISLEQPLASMEDYRHVAERLHALLPKSDPACKNPSRLSRLPGAIRPDTSKKQVLVKLNSRVPNEQLFALLPVPESPAEVSSGFRAPEDRNRWLNISLFRHIDAPDAAITEMGLGGRNAYFYWLGNRLAEAGADKQSRAALVRRAYSNLSNVQNFSLREAFSAARVRE